MSMRDLPDGPVSGIFVQSTGSAALDQPRAEPTKINPRLSPRMAELCWFTRLASRSLAG
jgi:hypothetical protein